MHLTALAICVSTSLFLAPAVADTALDPREDLDALIPHAISLLESKQYGKLIETLMEPEHVRALIQKKNKTLAELAEEFDPAEADRGLRIFRAILGKKPTLSDDGTKATYTLDQPVGTAKSITFVKKGKLWWVGLP